MNQLDAIEALENRIRSIEHANITNEARSESLDNWVLKQGNAITDVNDKLTTMDVNGAVIKESNEIKSMMKIIKSFEVQTRSIISESPKIKAKEQAKPISCEECNEEFSRNCDFENHLEDVHNTEKEFECTDCDQKFILAWRLKKNKECHIERTKCKCMNKICQYEHLEVIEIKITNSYWR